jgi:tetratricopeptide (TPR) repeat protein/TolB-like protein
VSRPPTDETVDEGRRGQDGGVDLSALLPRFTIKGTLGEGGMGVVVEAFDKLLSREVAIKLLRKHTDPTVGERFLREARAAAKLRDDGIVSVHDIDPDGGYIVMELIRGESLSARLHRERMLPVAELRRIGHKFLNALGTAHAAGIIHRDVKPANVLLGEKGEVKLADFGVAYFGDSELTSPEVRVGTPMYMAPEQLRAREVDARADVYAAGATLFEAATGKRLNADDTPKDPVALVLAATGDRALALAIGRATRERASERFANGREFAEALDATAASLAPPARGRRAILVLVLAVLVGGAAGGVAFYRARMAKKAHGHHAVALLPFVDATHAQQLDFASAGLPNLLGLELHGMPDVKVIGYYQLLSNVHAAESPPAEWVAAAKKLGADVLVHGELAPDPKGVHVTIRVEEADGEELATVERSGPVEQVPEIVRGSAPQVARAVAGREVGGAAHASTFAADRELQLGMAQLEREHLEEAIDHLTAAVHEAPQLAAAHFYLAIAQSWKAPPADPALDEIDKAIALGVDDSQRGLLEGVRSLVKQDYQKCIATLQPLAEKYPDDREILYVLFEALYHGGRPAESMAVFRRIVALEPRFRLGLVHAFTYYIARADDAGMTWALQLADPAGDVYNRDWEPRVLSARREYAAAIRLLSRLIDEATGQTGDLQSELVYAYVLNGQTELATAVVHKLGEASQAGLEVTLMGLATLRGDETDRKRWFEAALRHQDMMPMGPARNVGYQLIEVPALFVADRAELADLSQRLEESIIKDYGRALNLGIAQALLAEQLADKARLEKLAQSPYPEVADTAKAALARAAGDRKAAAEAMRGAIAATGDARFLINLQFLLAGDLHALGDQAGMATACDEVIRPRLFSWAWATGAPACKAWLAGSKGETPPTR